ncbi:MAG TPA: alpha-amylase family glycosyl hydrolase [Anaeromyxobacteraceae bacterium]|nr:alpha-amylase family glycosyl hydrolase [Anaeromyxobacteraceae bacterium]
MARRWIGFGGALGAALVAAACSSSSPVKYPTPDATAPLGATWSAGSATFRVWAPAAKAVSVLLFPAWDSTAPSAAYPMSKDLTGGGDVDPSGWNGVWEATATAVPEGQLYQYSLDGTPVLDPYARSMARFDSSTQGVGKGAVLDAVAIQPEDPLTHAATAWVPFTAPAGYLRREDAVIYEVHVRDFTILLDPASLANPPGSYEAFTERLQHVADLGATHVQLLPVLAYSYNDEGSQTPPPDLVVRSTGSNYDWGYDPQSWFSPEGMYSASPEDPAARVRELKTLVNEAHKLGLGVVLDVVYNHTANTGILDPLAPAYFYRGSNSSGTGNDTASERKMMRKLVVDSVRYLTETYHVDGFRFDLMGLVDSVTMEDAYAAARAVNNQVLVIGEGWRMPGVPSKDDQGNPIVPANQDWMAATDHFGVFSDSFRDIVKGGGFGEGDNSNTGFITSTSPFNPATVDKNALLRNLRGDPTNFAADAPGDVVQYVTAHDGLTLHDKVAKVLALNPDTQRAEILKVARLGLVLLATSQGTAFVHGGCEMGRTKRVPSAMAEATSGNVPNVYYVYNSYDSSDAVNGYQWTAWMAPGSEGERTYRYLQGLLSLRRSSDAFRLGDRTRAASNVTMLDGSSPYAIAYRVVSSSSADRFDVFVNAGTSAVTLATGRDLGAAAVVVDDDEAGAGPVGTPSGYDTLTPTTIRVFPRTAVVLKE